VRAKLAVCIVNWNTRELLLECLHSVMPAVADLQAEVVVVDNASADGSAAAVAREFPAVRLIANADNRYYAGGNNQALQAVTAEQYLLLNPDIVMPPGSLAVLREFMQNHPAAGAMAPRLRGVDGELQATCRTFPGPAVVLWEALGLSRWWPRSRVFGQYRMTWWGYDEARPVDQPMASALLIRGRALQQVGLFDEQFPMFFNDVDLCRRLWDGGWEVWLEPAAEMIHHGGAATRLVRREMIVESHRSFLLYYAKHYRGRLHPWVYGWTTGLLRLGAWVRLRAYDCRQWLARRRQTP
jgi:GT2 family glycosyltransferase